MKKSFIVIGVLSFIFLSCKKESCKVCYLAETSSNPSDTTYTSLGTKCGNELKDTDGKSYIGIDGPAKSYCK